jgi:hypothetical protein
VICLLAHFAVRTGSRSVPASGRLRQVLPQASSARTMMSNASSLPTRRGATICRLAGAPGTMSITVARHLGKLGAAQRIDEHAEAEVLSTKLCTRVPPPPWRRSPRRITMRSPGIQVTIDDVDDDGFLERSLVAFLVEAHFELLHRGRTLAGHQFAGVVFGRDVVGGRRIAGLEQRPVGIELEGQLEPGAIGQAGAADGVDQLQFGPFAGHQFGARAWTGCRGRAGSLLRSYSPTGAM